MKLLSSILLCAAAILAPAALPAAEPQRPPNFVILFVDDLGYGDIGPFGATKQKTPHLDRMAREGMKLTSFYAAPVCSVSRAQLLTGCYGARISVPGVFPPAHPQGLHPGENTIAERLKPLGYATACIGKWHLGDQPDFLPTTQGFDRYFGIPYSNDMARSATPDGPRVVPLLRDTKVIELLSNEQQRPLVERYTEEAISFMRENQKKPFFLYLPHTAVHTPIEPGAAFAGKSANGRFGDWVEEVDWSTGRILAALKEMKLDDKTLVVFTSDNGPWLKQGADGGSAGPLREGKGTTWEGGVRVPTLARWPGKIPAGSVSDEIAGTIDLLPTCVALAGGKLSAEPIIDGRDLSSFLVQKSKKSPREAHYYFASYNLQAIRKGPWKLAIGKQKTLNESDAAGLGAKPRLYDLANDIGEKTDLATQKPEIVKELMPLFEKMAASLSGPNAPERRPSGKVERARLLYETADAPKTTEPAASAPTTKNTTPAKSGETKALADLKPGDTLESSAAPNVGKQPFLILCDVECSQKNAIILAHGGAAMGYTLFLRDGLVVFTIRAEAGGAFSEISSSTPTTGLMKIRATLTPKKEMFLAVNDVVVATGQAPALLPRQPGEPFCLGHDSQTPVAEYHSPEAFVGSIQNLSIGRPAGPKGKGKAKKQK